MLKFKQRARKLEKKDFDIDDTEFYIKDFIAAESVTMIYSGSNQGKTWLSLAISHEIISTDNSLDELIYFDLDNGRRNIKKRKLQPFLDKHPKWGYYIGSNMDMKKEELLQVLSDDCYNMNYKNKVLVFDSARDFTDTESNKKAKEFMQIMKKIRDNGGTVIVIHHSTKNGKAIDGSGDFEKSADNLFYLEQKNRTGNILQLLLHMKKDRDDVFHCAFKIDSSMLSISPMDEKLAMMSEYEEKFVNKGKKALEKNPNGLSQTALLEYIGYEKTDKVARDTLDKFVDEFWHKHQQKKGASITYTAITTK